MSASSRILAIALALSASLATKAAHAAPPPIAVVPLHALAHRPVMDPTVGLTVHDMDGQRFDVPPELLRPDGALINGLAPQAAKFE